MREFGIPGYDYHDFTTYVEPVEPKGSAPDGYEFVKGIDYFGFPEWVCVPIKRNPVIDTSTFMEEWFNIDLKKD